LKLESVARADVRKAGMLPVAGSEPVHMAASKAGKPKLLILKRKTGRTVQTDDIVHSNFGHCT
jgi:hypothetical protein